ncbi:MAG: glutamine--fructose-6-phosphate transaminase (isomerizing) [Terrimicrobiaceae bacterium]
MCGIFGYTGRSEALPVLLDGLGRLEYRGYDSAGVAVLNGQGYQIRKAVGRVSDLSSAIERSAPMHGCLGISHTRWATHGGVTEENAHPHFDASGCISLVHNGVIENYGDLKSQLLKDGHTFQSETDSEVLAHLIGSFYQKSASRGIDGLLEALRGALRMVTGTYGIALLHTDARGFLIAARRGSPLVMGIGNHEHFIASDVSAIAPHTADVVYLNDYDIAVIDENRFEISTVSSPVASGFEISKVENAEDAAQKGEFPHYMLKEIYEQPMSLAKAMRGRLSTEIASAHFGGIHMSNEELRCLERIVLTGCGTTYHAALAGEYMIESLAHIPVECEYASEFRYRNLPLIKSTLVFVMSQSGETADALAALHESQRKGHHTLGICNNVASSIARESDGGIAMHAGPEIGVAATKSFTSELVILCMVGLLLGRIRNISHAEGLEIISWLERLPELVDRVLQLDGSIRLIAEKYYSARNFLFLGRQANFPIALEGALKLKEVSYISASGYPSAELKHGVIALINPETPSFFIAPQDSVFEKNLSNIQEVKARQGPVLAIGTEGDTQLERLCNDVILIPKTPDFLTPILTAIPLQLFAYHMGVTLGCDVDKPRNLAKSVTVE